MKNLVTSIFPTTILFLVVVILSEPCSKYLRKIYTNRYIKHLKKCLDLQESSKI
jgi:hypothetical protein